MFFAVARFLIDPFGIWRSRTTDGAIGYANDRGGQAPALRLIVKIVKILQILLQILLISGLNRENLANLDF